MKSKLIIQVSRLLVIFSSLLLASATTTSASDADVEMSNISGTVDNPRRHFRLRNPAALAPQEAQEIYHIAADALAKGYQRSGQPIAAEYQQWQRYNTTPYISSSHGNHYLNNYANRTAHTYGEFEKSGTLPVGSVIAKDSFSVTESRGILLGPLFIMVKMDEGFNPVSGDWKYMQIHADGRVLGETNGQGSAQVEYCIPCHLAVEHQDHLYFIPEQYRIGKGQ